MPGFLSMRPRPTRIGSLNRVNGQIGHYSQDLFDSYWMHGQGYVQAYDHLETCAGNGMYLDEAMDSLASFMASVSGTAYDRGRWDDLWRMVTKPVEFDYMRAARQFEDTYARIGPHGRDVRPAPEPERHIGPRYSVGARMGAEWVKLGWFEELDDAMHLFRRVMEDRERYTMYPTHLLEDQAHSIRDITHMNIVDHVEQRIVQTYAAQPLRDMVRRNRNRGYGPQ